MQPTRVLKVLAFAVALVLVAPLVLISWIERRVSRSEQVFALIAQLLALAPGLPGAYVRGAYYFGTLQDCSWETHIGFGSMFVHREASLARHASMGAYCVIGHACIGEATMIGSRVSIPSGKRQHLDRDGSLSSSEGSFERVSVGSGTWVGEGAILLASVGKRCIVSAGAVVTREMPDDTVVAGNPAQPVRDARRSAVPAMER